MQEVKNINGKTWGIDTATGEATEMVTLVVPIGSKITTPEQQQANIQRAIALKAKEQKEFFKNLQRHELGNFYFIFCSNAFLDIKPATTAKMIYLASYLDYDNRLMLTRKTALKKSDLARVLNISTGTAYKFYAEVKGKYLIERDGDLYISEKAQIFKHKLKPTGQQFLHYQKCYIKSIKKLYEQTPTRQHRQLGYIFKLLQYINLEYNVFGTDPFATNIDEIKPLSVTDFCSLINYDTSQSARLIKELSSLTFIVSGKKQYLISYCDCGTGTQKNKMIFVNPRIIYNGSDYKKVEVLGAFCNAE